MKNKPINPYVTSRGGIVIFGGPFPIARANVIAEKIKRSYDMHDELVAALRGVLADEYTPQSATKLSSYTVRRITEVLTKAEPRP